MCLCRWFCKLEKLRARAFLAYLREEPSRVGSIWPSVIWEVVMPLLVVVDEAPWACREGWSTRRDRQRCE